MFKNEKLTKEVLAKIAKAEKKTLDGMVGTRIEHDPALLIACLQTLSTDWMDRK